MVCLQTPYVLIGPTISEGLNVYRVPGILSEVDSRSKARVGHVHFVPDMVKKGLSLANVITCNEWTPPGPDRRSLVYGAINFPSHDLSPYVLEWSPKNMSFEALFTDDQPFLFHYPHLYKLSSALLAIPTTHEVGDDPDWPPEFGARYLSNHWADVWFVGPGPNPGLSLVSRTNICADSGVLIVGSKSRNGHDNILTITADGHRLLVWFTVYHFG